MRSSAVLAVALLAAASSPALAVPAGSAFSRRFARSDAVPSTQPVDESGALSFQDVKDFGKGFVDGFTGTLNAVTPLIGAVAPFLKREDLELLARQLGATQDESGALSFQDVKDFGKGFVDGFTGTLNAVTPLIGAVAPFLKREDIELLVRQLAATQDDESGALSFQDVKDFGKGFVDGFTGTLNAVTPLIGAVAPFLKREEIEMLARELGVTQDESGALSFQDVKDFGKGFVDGFTGTLNAVTPLIGAVAPFLKREDIEFLARELAARQDESGAFSFDDLKDLGKGFINGLTDTVNAVVPFATTVAPLLKSSPQQREFIEELTRRALEQYAKRSLEELD